MYIIIMPWRKRVSICLYEVSYICDESDRARVHTGTTDRQTIVTKHLDCMYRYRYCTYIHTYTYTH